MASTSVKSIGTPPHSVVSFVYRKCFPCVQYYLHLGLSVVLLWSLELRLTYVSQLRHT